MSINPVKESTKQFISDYFKSLDNSSMSQQSPLLTSKELKALKRNERVEYLLKFVKENNFPGVIQLLNTGVSLMQNENFSILKEFIIAQNKECIKRSLNHYIPMNDIWYSKRFESQYSQLISNPATLKMFKAGVDIDKILETLGIKSENNYRAYSFKNKIEESWIGAAVIHLNGSEQQVFINCLEEFAIENSNTTIMPSLISRALHNRKYELCKQLLEREDPISKMPYLKVIKINYSDLRSWVRGFGKAAYSNQDFSWIKKTDEEKAFHNWFLDGVIQNRFQIQQANGQKVQTLIDEFYIHLIEANDEPGLLWLVKKGVLPNSDEEALAKMQKHGYTSDSVKLKLLLKPDLLKKHLPLWNEILPWDFNNLLSLKALSSLSIQQLFDVVSILDIDLGQLRDDKKNTILHHWVNSYDIKAGWATLLRAFPELKNAVNEEGKTAIALQKEHLRNDYQRDQFEQSLSKVEESVLNKLVKNQVKQLASSPERKTGMSL